MEQQGRQFRYELPDGWTVGEEGPHALVLRAPGDVAAIVVFGLTGLMMPLDPLQFAVHALRDVMRLAPDVRFGAVGPIAPRPGYGAAAVAEVAYTVMSPMGPVPCLGLVFSNVAVTYGACSGVITLASARAEAWPAHASWLPGAALQAVNVGPNAYGSTAMAVQMHGIAAREGQVLAEHRAWSQATWAEVARHRADVDARQRDALGPMLTGQQWDADPFGGPAVRRSSTPRVVWVHRDGREVGSDDPSFDPRTPMDADWRRVDR